jgi:uncharacterized protein (TIGR00369 family)
MVEQRFEATWVPYEDAVGSYGSASGLDILQGIVKGTVPNAPIASILGFRLVEVEKGRAVFEVEPAGHHYNPIGTVHGGLAATLIDSATGCAVFSTLVAGDLWTTLDLTINFVRPMTAKVGPVRCTGTLVHIGSRIATAEGRLESPEGRLYAHGVSTCLIERATAAKA